MNRHSDPGTRADRISLWFVLMCVSVGLWSAFAKLVVPPIIESAWSGESLSLCNSIIEGHKFHPVEFYLTIWDGIALRGVVVLVTLWLLVAAVSRPAFFHRFVGEDTP